MMLAERALSAFKALEDTNGEWVVLLVVSNIDRFGKRQLWYMLLMTNAGYIRVYLLSNLTLATQSLALLPLIEAMQEIL